MISPKIRALYDHERDRAWEWARTRLVGPKPTREQFPVEWNTTYPKGVVILVITLSLLLLCFAFYPTALRLYESGKDACTSSYDVSDKKCMGVGLVTVAQGEIGQLIFLLSLPILGGIQLHGRTPRKLYWAGVAMTTIFALVGNLNTSEPWKENNLFEWFETLFPTLLVMGVGYTLKDVILLFVQVRYEQHVKYDKALVQWEHDSEYPESLSGWWREYSIALRNEIRKAHTRQKELLQDLSVEEWRWLIRREMVAGQWTVDPTQPITQEKVGDQPGNGHMVITAPQSGEIFENPDGTFGARSFITGVTLPRSYAKSGWAKLALGGYHRQLEKRRNGTKQIEVQP